MNHNWYIGQDIVCINTHSKGIVKDGEVYTIQGLRQRCCCIEINVGISLFSIMQRCKDCGHRIESDGIWWLHEHRFAPLDTLTDISEIEEILSQPIESLFKI